MKLNLGCGNDIRKDWINLDIASLPGVDVVWNIEQLPLPFENSLFDEILCNDILEHLDYPSLLKDLHRILKNDCLLKIKVPHFTSRNNFLDPTHKRRFSVNTFDFFLESTPYGRNYYFDFHFKNIDFSTITFNKKGFRIYNYLIEKIVNINPKFRFWYESTAFSYLFTAENIVVHLKK